MKNSIFKVIKGWEFDAEDIGAKLILGLVLLLIFYIVGIIFKNVFFRINSKLFYKHPELTLILSKVIYYIFVFLGYFLFLKIIGLEQYVTKILAGAGIVGIIAGFALKDIASNAFAGLLLFIKKPFRKDDWVQLDGHYGKVTMIGWLTTTIANKTGQEVSISNQLIYSSSFINYSKYKKRRICIQAQVHGYSDLPKLKSLLNDKIKNLNYLLPDTDVDFFVVSLGNIGNFTFEIRYWTFFDDGNTFRKLVSETMLAISDISSDNQISIDNTVWISDEEDGSSSGRFGSGG